MNRLTYRAKVKDKWLYGTYLAINNINMLSCNLFYNSEAGIFMIDKNTLCQCTDIYDANGNYVFENDIIKIGFDYYVVKWNIEQAKFELYDKDNNSHWGFNQNTVKNLEVVGNIYDDNYLLAKEN